MTFSEASNLCKGDKVMRDDKDLGIVAAVNKKKTSCVIVWLDGERTHDWDYMKNIELYINK